MDIGALVADLRAEQEELDRRVADLDEGGWATPTPAEGWDVADSVSHLCYFDETARLALTDSLSFAAHATDLMESGSTTMGTEIARSDDRSALLERWRASRAALLEALEAADQSERVPWYGPAMSLASFTTARIMETWAHGTDVADALGLPPVVSGRLHHVCHIGVGARAYSYLVNGVDDPGDPVRVEARGPDGDVWAWGPDDAHNRVSGPALDLALLLTQRRNRNDVDVTVGGPVADQWMRIAQSFAGPAGPGREPAPN